MTRVRSVLRLVVIPAGSLAVTVGVPLWFLGRLPDPMARHWSASGTPDGASSPILLTALAGGVVLVVWVALLLVERRGTPSSASSAVAFFLMSLLAVLQVVAVWANLDVAEWPEARAVGAPVALGAALVAVAFGGLGWVLTGSGAVPSGPAAAGPAPRMELGAGEDAVWFGMAESRGLAVLAVLLVGVAVVVGGVVAALVLVVAGLVVFFAAVRVGVSEHGVEIGLGWWGWPRRRIPLDEIMRAEVMDVEPLAMGGWGYRVVPGSMLRGARAVVVRRGPGIRLVRGMRPDLVVTVDGAAQGAGLVNALLERDGRVLPPTPGGGD